MVEVPSTGGRAPRVISKTVLAEIVEPRVTEIFTLVHKELVRASVEGMLTSGIVLTGGTSQLAGIADLAEQIFNCPVRLGVPTGFGGLTDLVRGPEYGTAIGLTQYAVQRRASAHLSRPRNFATKIIRKVSGLFSDYF
jgi:cell division protein FtsA